MPFRNSVGVSPTVFLNADEKCASLEYESFSATSFTLKPLRKSSFAFSAFSSAKAVITDLFAYFLNTALIYGTEKYVASEISASVIFSSIRLLKNS